MRIFFILSSLFFISLTASSQTYSIKGILQDETDKSPLRGATVRLTAQNDSLINYNVVTNNRGAFEFPSLAPRIYLMYVSSIGYDSLRQTIVLQNSNIDLKTVYVIKNAQLLGGVTVTASVPPVKQKADTLEYSASAFKVNPDALAEDMIKKMPGVTVDRTGTVTAQGETVQKITIDGKDFFGDDATAALRNLPAEIIDKIQVFDRMSDQSQFSGFDDGSAVKAINIVTKADMRNGQFGRVYAGYGTDERYAAGGNMSFFKDNRRISLVGLFNNINQQNFGSQDLLGVTSGGGGRGGGGGGGRGGGGWGNNNNNFLVGQQSGISKTNAFGINYSDQWGPQVKVSGSYFFNNSRNTNNESLNGQYTNDPDTLRTYEERSLATSDNYNHRMNMRIEYKIDSFNSLIITPNINLQNNNSISDRLSSRFDSTGLTSSSQALNDNKRTGYNIRNDILFRHAFKKRGRTASLNLNTGINKNEGDLYTFSNNTFLGKQQETIETLQQQYRDQLTTGYNIGGSISYTEPIGKMGQLEMSYNPSFTVNKSDQFTYLFDDPTGKYSILDTNLTNKFDNNFNTHRTGLTFRKGNRENMISFGLSYQYAELSSTQVFPNSFMLNKSFNNFLPNAMINKKLTEKSSIRLFYRTSTNAPSVNQLQDVINNVNPLQWSTGNPDLKQQYTNILGTRYSFTNSSVGNSLFANVFIQKIDNYISNAIYVAQSDSFVVGFPDTLRANSQISKPVNVNGYMSLRSFLTYGLPLKFIKSNLNLNAGFTYSRLPGVFNYNTTLTNNYGYNMGAVLASNISEYIDFNLSYSANYNVVKASGENARTNNSNNNYFSHNAGIQINMLSKSGWILQNDLNNQFYNGLSEGFNQNFWLWNLSFGKKFLPQQKGEVKLTVFDLLAQNQSITRNIEANTIEDVQNQVLQQYFMLTFTYKLRNFGKKKAGNDSRPQEEGPAFPGPRGYPGQGPGGFQGRPQGGF